MKLQKHISVPSQLKYVYIGVSSCKYLLSSHYVPSNILEMIEFKYRVMQKNVYTHFE